MERTRGTHSAKLVCQLDAVKKLLSYFFLFVNNYKYFAQMVFTWLPKTLTITIVSNLKPVVTNSSNFKVALSRY